MDDKTTNMNKLVQQALKDLRLTPDDEKYILCKLWLEKMYIAGNIEAVERMQEITIK